MRAIVFARAAAARKQISVAYAVLFYLVDKRPLYSVLSCHFIKSLGAVFADNAVYPITILTFLVLILSAAMCCPRPLRFFDFFLAILL